MIAIVVAEDEKHSKDKNTGRVDDSTASISKRINVVSKLLAFLVIFISASIHFYRLFSFEHEGQTCPLLFESGHWIGSKWQPDGCMMHEYKSSEIRTCLQNKQIILLGDSRLRSLYFQLANSVSQEPVPTGKHEDLAYRNQKNTSIEFYWLPKLNDDVGKLLKKWVSNPTKLPQLIIMGVATWRIKAGDLTAIVDYQDELKKLSPALEFISKNLTFQNILNKPSSRYHHEPQLIWIMQDPVVESKLSSPRQKITNEKLDMYNYAAAKSLRTYSPHVRILKSTTKMAAGKPDETVDGLHYSSVVVKKKADAVLNAFCNNYIYPDDASCCKDLERISPLQFNAFAVLATCVILWLLMLFCQKIRNKNVKGFSDIEIRKYEATSVLPWLYVDSMYDGMKAMAKLSVIMLYVFLADSSLLYNKDHKRYSREAFFIPLVGLLVVGLMTREPVKQTTILNEDQMQEWKGWMVIVMMLYLYTDAQEMLPVFVNVRLLISSFLFMTGFVYFRQFWYEADFGLYKICKVMAHLNLFCVALCLVMGHSYQHYHIVPLLSFWFFVVYLSMAWFPRVTYKDVVSDPRNNFWMIAKLVILFTVVFVIWGHENVCEWIFSRNFIRELFVDADGHVSHWRLNSGLDRYSVIFGMVCSYIYVTLKHHQIVKDDDNVNTILPSKTISLVVVVLASIGLVGYEIQAFTCHTKALCDQTHPVASIIPILSYLLLRNIPGFLRSKYSVFFAWVGDMSLELFIGQYHIWLSNDTHGIHVLIPGFPTINAFVTTFTLACVIHEVKKISTILAEQLVTKDIWVMLRRLIIFIIGLGIIWWHKTHEKRPS